MSGSASTRLRWKASASALVVLAVLTGCSNQGSAVITPGASAPGSQAPTGSGPGSTTGGVLRLLTWEGYDDPALVAAFEDATGAVVEPTYVGSVDELYTKTKTAGATYDLVFPDSSAMARYIDEGLIQPIDETLVPNLSNRLRFWAAQDYNVRDGRLYGVPFASGSTPLLYDTTVFPAAPSSWSVLWDPAYAGRIAGLDDSNPMIVITALYLGLDDPFALSDGEFDMVADALREQIALARQYYAGFDEGVTLFSSGEAVVGVSMEPGMYKDINEAGGSFAETIPQEGAIEWVDNGAIPVGAARPDLAHRYLDLALTTDVQATFVRDYSFFPIVDVSAALTPEELAAIGDIDAVAERLILLKTPEDPERRNRVWLEARAGA